ncbi:MAG TPA: lamin tail domain-containing protein, partial [Pyrinomonadaceae bacterium]
NINGSSGIPSNAAVRFVPTADTLAAYQDNDTGARFVVDTASYGTPGAPNTGVPGDTSIFSAGGAPLIISEFRTFGPTGSCDEFIEIYNTSSSPYTVQSLGAGSLGFAVAQSNGNVLFTIPNNTTIPARGHYLAVNNGGGGCTGSFSGSAYPAGNGMTATGDNTLNENIPETNTGIAIFNTSLQAGFTLANRLDAVGPTTEPNALYREGAGYPQIDYDPLSATAQPNYSLYRDARSGLPRDTDDNDADFEVASIFAETLCFPTANFNCSQLGAPGPENLSSPTQRNAEIKASLIDPNCTGMAVNPTLPSACRFERRTGAGSGAGSSPTLTGTLSIRRRFTNNTGLTVTRLRFRIVDISTYLGGSAAGTPGIADLRAITSSSITATCQSEGGTPHLCSDNASPQTTIEGTTLETDANGQPNGGGFNSTLAAGTITPGTGLAPGATINIQFLLGVEQNGSFRFFVNIEALTSAPAPPLTKAQATGKRRTAMGSK